MLRGASLMALREEMEQEGQWLFRWRSYLPVAMLIVLAAGMFGFQYPDGSRAKQDAWEAMCLLVSLVGVGVRALVIGYAPGGTSGRNTADGQVADVLNTTGLYGFVRHPLYLGNFLMWVGVAMLPRNAWLVAVVSLAFWLYYERIMLAEEAFLRGRFSGAYEVWAATTPPFLPKLTALVSGTWKPPVLPFSFRNVLKREYSGVLAVALLLGLVDMFGAWLVTGRAEPDGFALSTMIVGVALYLVLRTLKRQTRVLHVEGR
jgi:protein-S-isoprenylcysteine O-methyltransferase Ste14